MSGQSIQDAASAAVESAMEQSGEAQPKVSPSQAFASLESDGKVGSGKVESQVKADANFQELSSEQGQALDQATDEIQEAIENGASEQEVQRMIHKAKIKVFGKEIEKEIDLNDKDELNRQLQLAAASHEVFQQKAELERLQRDFLRKMNENPWELMEELGLDTEEILGSRVENILKEAEMSPEEKARTAAEKELDELRQKVQEEKQRAERLEFEQLQRQYEVDLNNEIIDALNATTELPKTPMAIRRIATAILDANRQGYQASAHDVLPWVVKEYKEEMNAHLEAMPDDALEKYISKNVVDKLRKARIQKNTAPTRTIVDTGKKKEESVQEKKIKLNDFLRATRNIKGY